MLKSLYFSCVVVWCRNQKIYNESQEAFEEATLWFGVGIKRYTTSFNTHHRMTGCGLV